MRTVLASLHVRFEQVYDLDSRIEHLLRGGQFIEFRRFPVYGVRTLAVEFPHAIYAFAYHVHEPSFHLVSDRHRYGLPLCRYRKMSSETVCRIHRDGSDGVLSYMLLDFDDEFRPVRPCHRHRFVYPRKHTPFSEFRKMDIYDRSYDL